MLCCGGCRRRSDGAIWAVARPFGRRGGGCWSEAGPGLELGTGPGHLLMSAVNEHQLIPLLLASQIAKIKD